MENEFREKQRKNYNMMRSVSSISMGIVIIAIGGMVFFSDKIGLNLSENYSPLMLNIFAGMCLLYGGFRLYRGIKKDA